MSLCIWKCHERRQLQSAAVFVLFFFVYKVPLVFPGGREYHEIRKSGTFVPDGKDRTPMKQWMKRTSAAVLAGLALTSSALASGTAVTLQENAVPATQITAPAQQDWRLLLVNAWNLLPESYTVELVRLKNGLQVDKRIYDDLNAMLTDCRAAGLQPIVCSAYRTQATQTRLYNNKVSRLRAVG